MCGVKLSMTTNPSIKSKVIRMRRLGKSYNFIADSFRLSKSTIAYWFKDIDWSKDIRNRLTERQRRGAKKQIELMNAARKRKLARYYLQAQQEAEKEFCFLKKNRLFVAGIMIYWGEGDRSVENGQLRISNVDPRMINVFMRFLKDIFKIDSEKIRAWLLLYPDLKESSCIRYWLGGTGLSRSCFTKSVVIERRGLGKKLSYGVCNVGTTSKYLKTKLLKWIDLLAHEIVYYKQLP